MDRTTCTVCGAWLGDDELIALRSEIEKESVDARRYRFLRNDASWRLAVKMYDDGDWRRIHQVLLDNVIDQAMQEELSLLKRPETDLTKEEKEKARTASAILDKSQLEAAAFRKKLFEARQLLSSFGHLSRNNYAQLAAETVDEIDAALGYIPPKAAP